MKNRQRPFGYNICFIFSIAAICINTYYNRQVRVPIPQGGDLRQAESAGEAVDSLSRLI
jgi:hypothetical protein